MACTRPFFGKPTRTTIQMLILSACFVDSSPVRIVSVLLWKKKWQNVIHIDDTNQNRYYVQGKTMLCHKHQVEIFACTVRNHVRPARHGEHKGKRGSKGSASSTTAPACAPPSLKREGFTWPVANLADGIECSLCLQLPTAAMEAACVPGCSMQLGFGYGEATLA